MDKFERVEQYWSNGELAINPSVEELLESDMELILSGSDKSIVMVEGKCNFVSEGDVLEAIKFGHEEIKKLVVEEGKCELTAADSFLR